MGGDSESAFKNTPIQIIFISEGPFHKNFLKIWASDLVGAIFMRIVHITMCLRVLRDALGVGWSILGKNLKFDWMCTMI